MRGLGDLKDWAVRQGQCGPLVVSLSTAFALVVHGYHPYAEDGGLYVAGIKKVLDPGLYGPHAEFVTEHLRFSMFAPMVAGLVRGTAVPLPWILLGVYVASIWMTLCAGWMIASRCVESVAGRTGAVALLACWLTLPIAGTSLMLMDPYLTARSLSTPLVMLALAWAMDGAAQPIRRGWLMCAAALGLAALLHPLMAAYGAAAVLMMACLGARSRKTRRWGPVVLCVAALGIAGALQMKADAESAEYVRVAMTRYYWFPGEWQWYEQIGMIAPLAVIAALGCRRHAGHQRLLAGTAVAAGVIAILVALCFARVGLAAHPVARLQPLRCLQMVYAVMILLLGAWLGDRWLRAETWRWCTMLVLLGGVMFTAQRRIYAASAHLEMPWLEPTNPWEQGFVWVRDHMPREAVFALDARYITRGKDEDAQCFRAIAERDALPDYSKDGGEASITPSLTDAWVRGQAAQGGLDHQSDAAREAALKPLGATWAVLDAKSATQWQCPYSNGTVKVCRLP